MRIVKLTTENIKKLRAVEITPTGDLVVIAGKNDAGKSSVLDSIAMALGGAAMIPGAPVRQGQKGGKVTVDLGEFTVTRTFTASGGGGLTVENKQGARFKSPQAMLDKLLGALTFDPLAFEREEPKAQADILRRLVGLDTRDLDTSRAELYEQRTRQNREVKALEGELDRHPGFDQAPDQEVSVAALLEQAAAAEQLQRAAVQADVDLRTATTAQAQASTALDLAQRELERCRAAFVAAENEVDFWEKSFAREGLAVAERVKARDVAAAAVPDTAALRASIQAAQDTNRQVQANQARERASAALAAAEKVAEGLSARILDLDRQRAARIAAAAFPVPGLGIADDGTILFEGLPFDQASTSARLRVSVAIGLAMNRTLRVMLVRDGSLLDAANLKLVAEMAAAADTQLWVEMMQESPSDQATVFIEDGAVRS